MGSRSKVGQRLLVFLSFFLSKCGLENEIWRDAAIQLGAFFSFVLAAKRGKLAGFSVVCRDVFTQF